MNRLGWAWLALCGVFAAHIADENATGFLSVYNPTVIEVRHRFAWFPMPAFEHGEWLWGLIGAVTLVFLLSPFAFRGARWLRPLAYFLAGVMLLNGLGHTLFTILGRTVESVHFPRPAPGFWSSPLLIASSLWMFRELYLTRAAGRVLAPPLLDFGACRRRPSYPVRSTLLGRPSAISKTSRCAPCGC